jgi:hypothetical protein
MENIRRHVPGDRWPVVASWQRCIQGVWTKVVHFFHDKCRASEHQCTTHPRTTCGMGTFSGT